MLLVTVISLLSLSATDSIPAGTQLSYRGRFAALKGDLAASEKQFDLTFVIGPKNAQTTPVYWTLDERGHGGWSWLDRFGKWELNEKLVPGGGLGPALAYERPDGLSVVPLQAPMLAYSEPLQVGVAWFEGTLEFQVAAEESIQGKSTWRIDVRSPIGRRRSIWVDKDSPLTVAMTETIFIGQGEPHELHWELTNQQVLENAAWESTVSAFDEFLRLRQRLQLEPRTRDVPWNVDRLALLKADLPTVSAKARGTVLEKLAGIAEQEAKNQKDRANALGALHGKLVGRAAPDVTLETLQGEKFSWPDIKGKVTVLHFWEYRDMPLEEPYGQVAYLDFLARAHSADDVKVFGVIADERVLQPDTKRSGIQAAKKLQSFMNLSYPLLVDTGSSIKAFGDPRATGAKLPLFVVIDRQGKVVHYHAGFYEVNRDRGLVELGAVIKQALGKKE